MVAKRIRRAVVTLYTTSCRVVRVAIAFLRFRRFECYAILSDGWYLLFGRAPVSLNQSDLLVHVIKSLEPRRRAAVILMALNQVGITQTAERLAISIRRASRLHLSGLESVEFRLKWHGVEQLVPGAPPPTKSLPPAAPGMRLAVMMSAPATESVLQDVA